MRFIFGLLSLGVGDNMRGLKGETNTTTAINLRPEFFEDKPAKCGFYGGDNVAACCDATFQNLFPNQKDDNCYELTSATLTNGTVLASDNFYAQDGSGWQGAGIDPACCIGSPVEGHWNNRIPLDWLKWCDRCTLSAKRVTRKCGEGKNLTAVLDSSPWGAYCNATRAGNEEAVKKYMTGVTYTPLTEDDTTILI